MQQICPIHRPSGAILHTSLRQPTISIYNALVNLALTAVEQQQLRSRRPLFEEFNIDPRRPVSALAAEWRWETPVIQRVLPHDLPNRKGERMHDARSQGAEQQFARDHYAARDFAPAESS
jgi:hypothetical protein